MWAFFPSSFHSLLLQLLFQQLGPCPALLAKPSVDSVVQGTQAPLQSSLFTAYFPVMITRNLCNRGGKGGGPVDNFSTQIYPRHSRKQKFRHAGTEEPRQTENPASVLPFGSGTALIADQ